MLAALKSRVGSPQAPTSLPESGSYVTDGLRLFRVVSQFATVGKHVFASLEDCRTLEVRAYSPGELGEMGLRPVGRSTTGCG